MGKVEALRRNSIKYAKLFASRWKTPKEGYDVSYKELTAASLGHMGHASILDISQYVELTSTSAVISMIFGISFTYIYVIGIMNNILMYLLTGINGQIMDGLGKISKKTLTVFSICSGVAIAIMSALAFSGWSVVQSLDAFLPNFMLHLLIVTVFRIAPVYMNIIIYRLFGKRWGKFKPWLVLMGLPIVAVSSAIAFIDITNMTPNNVLLVVSVLTNLLGCLKSSYLVDNLSRFQVLMTRNRQERVIMNSIFPVIGGLFSSLLGLFLGPLATLLDTEINSIEIYRLVIPIFGLISLIPTSLLLMCHERTNVSPKEKQAHAVSFIAGLKSVIKNKYLWAIKLSGSFNVISSFSLMVMQWMLLYGTKMQWISGILIAIASIPATPANLITPFLTKKFSNRQIFCGLKLIQSLAILSCLLIIKIPNEMVSLILLLVMSCICTFCNKPCSVVGKACLADAWDFHQWKFGERIEGASNYFNYITLPIATLLGFMTPFLYKQVGFIGDYDIMYATDMRNKVFIVHVVLYAFEIFMCGLPYIFFDLTPSKMKQIYKDLETRATL